MTIGEALRRAAEDAEWSFSKVASETITGEPGDQGVSESTVRRWMTGATMPPGDRLHALRQRLPGLAELLDGKAVA